MNYNCTCKATDKEEGLPKYSQSWVKAIRGKFNILNNRIECENINIPYSEITSAHLYLVKSFFHIPGKVLQIKTGSKCYQFGMYPWAKIEKYLPIPFTISSVKVLGYPYGSTPKKNKMVFLAVACILVAYCLVT